MSEEKKATPSEELRRQATDLHEGEHKVSDFNEPVTEAEWWAKGRIEQLEAENKRLREALEKTVVEWDDYTPGTHFARLKAALDKEYKP